MRIIEIRRFLDFFIVYVNTPEDIAKLKKDKRFSVYAIYEFANKLQGYEFSFHTKAKTLKGAKQFVINVLGKDALTKEDEDSEL